MRRLHAGALLAATCAALLPLPAAGETIYATPTASGRIVYSNKPVGESAVVVMELAPAVAAGRGAWSMGSAGTLAHQPSPRRARAAPVPDAATLSLVQQAARRHALDVDLLLALIRQESGFNPAAVSHAGARGLMQLMPATAKRYGASQLHDPGENIAAGSAYLRDLLDMFGDVQLALAAYNAGEGAVLKYGKRIPPYNETQNYVRAVLADYQRRLAER